MIAAIEHGFGRHNVYISPSDKGFISSYLLGVFMTGVAVSGFARISIACLLLRFTTNRMWRIIIWITLVLQVGMVLTYEIVQLVQCKSVISDKVRWRGSSCLTKSQVWAFTYVSVSKYLRRDLVCRQVKSLNRLTRCTRRCCNGKRLCVRRSPPFRRLEPFEVRDRENAYLHSYGILPARHGVWRPETLLHDSLRFQQRRWILVAVTGIFLVPHGRGRHHYRCLRTFTERPH
jgi:hypothetical protein